MSTHMRWSELDSSIFTPEQRASRKQKAIADYKRELGIPDLRKYRNVTQVALAKKMKLSQSTVAGIEGRSDVQLLTLSRYIKALGGELQISAVFPDAIVALATPKSKS